MAFLPLATGTACRENDSGVIPRLREVYETLEYPFNEEKGRPQLSDSLQELFTVTLNTELLCPSRDETLSSLRRKCLLWYREVYHNLCGEQNLRNVVGYWVAGIVEYEFSKIENFAPSAEEKSKYVWENDMIRALFHAMELRDVLARFPQLVAFLFAWEADLRDPQKSNVFLRSIIASCPKTNHRLQLLKRLLASAVRGCACGHREYVRDSCAGICQLIQLYSPSTRSAEEQIDEAVVWGVLARSRICFKRETLVLLLDQIKSDSLARLRFVLEEWPQYCQRELDVVRELPTVGEAWIKGLLTMHVYLWDTRDGCHTLGRVANEAINSTSDLSHTFLFQLLLLILKQPFSDFLDVKVSTHANGTVETFLLVARSMAYIEIPLLQPTPRMVRCWGCIFPSIPVPECGTRDVGFVVFAKVVRRLLEKHIESAFGYFLGRIDEFDEEQRQNSWRNLVVYLLRSEQVLWRLCEIPALKSHLLGSERGASSNNNMFCFYIYVREALLSHRQRQEDVDTLVNILLDSAHTYLLQADIPPETLPQSAGSVPDTEESSTKVVQLLSNEGDLDSALRLAQNLVSRGRFLSLYKARLAHRLLHMITTARLQNFGIDVAFGKQWCKKLGLEKALCVRLLSGPSDEQGAIQHMIRMCCDVEAMFDGQVLLHKNECTNERVKLNVEMISPFVWPTFPVLEVVNRPLRQAMSVFSRLYEKHHCSRRVIWLRTSFETFTFNVAYPSGDKVVTGPLELYTLFEVLSEKKSVETVRIGEEDTSSGACCSGLAWGELAKKVGRQFALLQHDVHRLVRRGLIVFVPPLPWPEPGQIPPADVSEIPVPQPDSATGRVFLNAAFVSRRSHYCFLPTHTRKWNRAVTIAGQGDDVSGVLRSSHIWVTQAAIMSQLKPRGCCCYSELLSLTRESIRGKFQLRDTEFKMALEQLIEKEYVERSSDQKQFFFYKA